jgi:glc operon protein GlcG
MVFSGEINEWKYGIHRPNFIGWVGGQPIVLKDGTQLSIGFSGFRGESDLSIVMKAVSQLDM